jgi:trigger factor
VEEARAAKNGDSLKIDFDGSVDGEARPGMKGEGHMLELGSNSFIPGFEEQLVGVKAGEEKTITVSFPTEYHAKELAGKEAQFKITVHELHEPSESKVDDEMAKGFGFESLAQLKDKIRGNMADSYKRAARLKAKRVLLDKLADAHSFEVPQGMVDFEFDAIWKQREQQGADPEEKGTTEDEIKAEYRDIAERRVRLGLLLAEIGRKQKIDITQDELRNAVFQRAREFPGQERQVIEFYMKNEEAPTVCALRSSRTKWWISCSSLST